MKKVKRLIKIKHQIQLANTRQERAVKRKERLTKEQAKVLASFTEDEKRLYKDKIERACRL